MPSSTVLDIRPGELAQMLAALWRTGYGYLLALRMLLLCATGREPTVIAVFFFCSRSSVYRTVRVYRAGTLGLEHDEHKPLAPPVRTTVLVPMLRRSLGTLLEAPTWAHGWYRTA